MTETTDRQLASPAQRFWSTLAVLGALALGVWISSPAAQASAATTIAVNAAQTNGTISPAVMGSTYLPPFDGMGSFDAGTDSFWPSFIGDLQNQVYTGSLRWPGGITSQYYDWRRAIGPQSQRTDNAYGPTSGPSTSTVGPDEFGQLLDDTGAAGISTVNFATGDPTEAAEFVQYMTGANGSSSWADLRAQNGHPQPYDVPVWEVGNEEYTTASSWRGGTVVSVGGNGACTADAATCQYIYGGSDSFTKQAVVGYADRSASAADSTGPRTRASMSPTRRSRRAHRRSTSVGRNGRRSARWPAPLPPPRTTRSMTRPERSPSATARMVPSRRPEMW